MSLREGRCDSRANLSPSPTNSATSTTPSERHHYQQPSVQPAATQGATSEGYHGLQDAAHSQAPINSRRQDSAIAQYRNETSKESSSFAPSEPDVFYSRRSPNDRHLSDSPRLTSHFVPHSSGPSASHHPTTSPRFSEHVTPAATNYHETGINPSSRSAAATGAPDHASPGTTRQQRYNVRFAVNYSSTNMPPTQRPRPSSPLPAATMAHAEPVESLPVARIESSPPPAEDTAPRVERMPKPDAISMILGQRRSPAPSTSSVDVPVQSADRCPGCHDVYKAPPAPSMTEWSQQEPAKNAMDYAKATEGFFALQRENAKAAADDYQTWREKHTRCPVPRGLPPTHTTSNGATNGHSNKRKNDVPHDDTARPRRTTFDSHATSATPVRPTAPAV